ncbi:unnamed protein product [Zymoseptoria tritici ST99CH_3D1]|uniref:SMP-30/Gluconolactonase/LRE-like region domain-containing protein n=2 Tax=Zymoseptoria tritici TaxID=1047171 RepID=A0A1X7RJA3_ZYMT9|nr:unnamed protein product [Zymoseptoria tritici ST99CH_3D7]SMR46034.1 unnamed protein product [Zymoseptoria tritici ST99CH_1E4]SMR47288.1 unnamed protein product [Zymoseptoria tritici ST99CH_3D1]
MVNITAVDLLQLASSIPYASQLNSLAESITDAVGFISYNQSFITDVLGTNVTEALASNQSYEAFHEAGVYNIATGKLYATSNWASDFNNPINVTTIDLNNNDAIASARYKNVQNANGGAAFYPPGTPANSSEGQQIVFCDEGQTDLSPSQLTLVDPSTNTTRVLLNNYFGANFSSINDVVQHPLTGDLYFTDARYAYWQNFGPTPTLRPQVYRFSPTTGQVQAIADDFVAPNGIELSPDWKHLYVTDTGRNQRGNETRDYVNPANIYRFDIAADGGLENRHVFAYTSGGIPDGIHTDTMGNVYSGLNDGVYVWNPHGQMIGKIAVGGTEAVANFAFVPGGMYIFHEYKLWKISIKAEGRTVRRDFGLY